MRPVTLRGIPTRVPDSRQTCRNRIRLIAPDGFAPTLIYLHSEGYDLTLACTSELTGAEPSRTMELGFEVDDFSLVKEHLTSRGVRQFREESMGWRSAVELRDPEGHRILIYALRHQADEDGGGGPGGD
jgi:hypothetical protein